MLSDEPDRVGKPPAPAWPEPFKGDATRQARWRGHPWIEGPRSKILPPEEGAFLIAVVWIEPWTAANIRREYRAVPVPPEPPRLMDSVDAAPVEQVLDVPQGQRHAVLPLAALALVA